MFVSRLRRNRTSAEADSARIPSHGWHRVPDDFHDELAGELDATNRALAAEIQRLSILVELQRVVATTTNRLSRPLTVVELIDSARDEAERERVLELVGQLRQAPRPRKRPKRP